MLQDRWTAWTFIGSLGAVGAVWCLFSALEWLKGSPAAIAVVWIALMLFLPGAILGAAQALVLRRPAPELAARWILATSLGGAPAVALGGTGLMVLALRAPRMGCIHRSTGIVDLLYAAASIAAGWAALVLAQALVLRGRGAAAWLKAALPGCVVVALLPLAGFAIFGATTGPVLQNGLAGGANSR